jgi:hypothetical protein
MVGIQGRVCSRVRLACVVGLGLTVLGLGCAPGRDVARFRSFADTGRDYTLVMDSLVVVTGNVSLDANSERLLRDRDLAAVSDDSLDAQDEAQRGYLSELLLVREELRLLGKYFAALGDLASGDLAGDVTKHLDEDTRAISDLSEKIGRSTLIGNEEALTKAAQRVGTVIVAHVQRSALRKECEARKDTIARVLSLHEELLEALVDDLLDNLGRLRAWRYDDDVTAPFLDSGKLTTDRDKSAWIALRRELLFPRWRSEDLERAVESARGLRKAWGALLAGGSGGTSAEGLKQDLESVGRAIRVVRGDIGD